MKKYWPIAAVVIAIVVVVGLALANKNDSSSPASTNTNTSPPPTSSTEHSESMNPTTPPASTSQPSSTDSVTISNFSFAPAEITVKKGTTVKWTNQDSVAHTVTADSGSGPNSELLEQGESYNFTFDTAGTFAYHCKPHPNMKAKVIVTE
jgi:plastocyanin